MKINLTSVDVDDREQALRFYTEVPPTDVTGSRIVRLNDTCGNLIQVTPLLRW